MNIIILTQCVKQCKQLKMLVWNKFNTPKKVDIIGLKGLYLFIFKVWGPKYIKVLDNN